MGGLARLFTSVLPGFFRAAPKVAGTTAAVAGGTAVVAGGASIADVSANGGDGWIGNLFQWMTQAPGEGGARAQLGIAAEAFYATIEQIGRGLSLISKGMGLQSDMGIGLQNWAREAQGLDLLTTDVFGKPLPGTSATTNANADPNDPAAGTLDTREYAMDNETLVTPENALTIENLANDLNQPVTMEGFLHGSHVAATAGIDAAVSTVAVIPGIVDAFDDGYDALVGLFGGDTGAENRDMSKAFKDATLDGIYSVVPRAELTSAWDQALYGGVNTASYFISAPVGMVRFATDVGQGTENLQATGNFFQERRILGPGEQ